MRRRRHQTLATIPQAANECDSRMVARPPQRQSCAEALLLARWVEGGGIDAVVHGPHTMLRMPTCSTTSRRVRSEFAITTRAAWMRQPFRQETHPMEGCGFRGLEADSAADRRKSAVNVVDPIGRRKRTIPAVHHDMPSAASHHRRLARGPPRPGGPPESIGLYGLWALGGRLRSAADLSSSATRYATTWTTPPARAR